MRAIGQQKLTLSELYTICAKVESILNFRPISYRKTNEFVEPLTPGHFLIGQNFIELPVADDSAELKIKERYFLWKRVVELFWYTWRKDYLNRLQVRNKWKHAIRNLCLGDVVIVASKSESIFSWPLGIVD